MNFEVQLNRLADDYKAKGYQVIVKPRAEDLPPFARDFKVQIVGKRNGDGVLVSVKKNRQEMTCDQDMARYAQVTRMQPGWRYDLAVLESEDPLTRELQGAEEPSEDGIQKYLETAERLIDAGQVDAAFLMAWSGFEAAMRRRLRAAGEQAGWGTVPRTLLNELYASGTFSIEEFRLLEKLYQLRSRLAHGFAADTVDAATVRSLVALGRRLLEESHLASLSA